MRPLGDVVRVVRDQFHPAKADPSAVVDLYSFGAFDEFGTPVATQVGNIKSNKLVLPGDTILLSRLNPHIPRVWRVRLEGDRPAVSSTEFIALIPDGEVDLDFLYYACADPAFLARMAELVTGTSGSHQRVRLNDVLDIPIPVPPTEVQVRCARALTNIDAKVQVARRLAELGEEWAAARYRQVFSDGSGRTTPLSEVVQLSRGVSYRRHDLDHGEAELVTLKCVGRNGEFRHQGIRPFGGAYKVDQVLRHGDVAVAVTDLTQRADVIGRPIRLGRGTRVRVASLDLVVVRPRGSEMAREWLYLTLKTQKFRRHTAGHANGTTVLHLSLSAFESFGVELPDEDSLSAFSEETRPFLSLRDQAEAEELRLGELKNAWRAAMLSGGSQAMRLCGSTRRQSSSHPRTR